MGLKPYLVDSLLFRNAGAFGLLSAVFVQVALPSFWAPIAPFVRLSKVFLIREKFYRGFYTTAK
jgi:hypothetical protein